MVDRVVIIHSDYGRAVDGIRDHGERLANELSRGSLRAEHRVHSVGSKPGGGRRLLRTLWELRSSGKGSVIFLQYMPFCFARWGFAPWLPLGLLAVRSAGSRPTIAVMIHEPYMPMTSWRWALMGLWQRLQLKAILLSADVAFTSIDFWSKGIVAQWPKRPVHHLPVGSNFPDRRHERNAARRQLEVTGDTLVLAAIGRDHPTWLAEYVVEAANAISASGIRLALLILGAEAPVLSGLDSAIEVRSPGYLDAGRLASMLAAADLFLAPLSDGISTRRGTVMAALQHGRPIVGTSGPLTDGILRDSSDAVTLVRVGDPESFAAAAVCLAKDPTARAVSEDAARALYEQNFDWNVLAGKMLAALPER